MLLIHRVRLLDLLFPPFLCHIPKLLLASDLVILQVAYIELVSHRNACPVICSNCHVSTIRGNDGSSRRVTQKLRCNLLFMSILDL